MNLRDSIETDVGEVLLADFGVACQYQAKGAGAKFDVVARVTAMAPYVRKPELLQTMGQGRSHKGHVFKVLLPAPTTAELAANPAAGTVTASGGVVQLVPGDVLIVPGSSVNRPRDAQVGLTVQEGKPRMLGGKWTCEAFA